MSRIIEYGRSMLGWSNQQPKEVTQQLSEEDTQRFLRKQQAEIGQLNNRLKKILGEIESEKNRDLLRLKLRERDTCKEQIARIQATINNINGVQQTVSTAESNVQTGLILKNANTKIKQSTDFAEKIDLDEIVDTYQENAQLTNDFSDKLSQPWLKPNHVDDNAIEDELDNILNEDAELDKWLSMPSVSQTKISNDPVNPQKTKIPNKMNI
jgi:hypothetical protein